MRSDTARFLVHWPVPALRAITPDSATSDLYRDVVYPGGVLEYDFTFAWTAVQKEGGYQYAATGGPADGDIQCEQNFASHEVANSSPSEALTISIAGNDKRRTVAVQLLSQVKQLSLKLEGTRYPIGESAVRVQGPSRNVLHARRQGVSRKIASPTSIQEASAFVPYH